MGKGVHGGGSGESNNGKGNRAKCMLRVGDDDIESPYKIVPDIFDFLGYKVVSVFVSLS